MTVNHASRMHSSYLTQNQGKIRPLQNIRLHYNTFKPLCLILATSEVHNNSCTPYPLAVRCFSEINMTQDASLSHDTGWKSLKAGQDNACKNILAFKCQQRFSTWCSQPESISNSTIYYIVMTFSIQNYNIKVWVYPSCRLGSVLRMYSNIFRARCYFSWFSALLQHLISHFAWTAQTAKWRNHLLTWHASMLAAGFHYRFSSEDLEPTTNRFYRFTTDFTHFCSEN